jgi:hypothetical protein
MSKKTRMEFSQARDRQSDKAAFTAVASQPKRKSPSRTPEDVVQMERAERAAQEKSASYAASGWPESLAEYRGFQFARTNGSYQLAVAAARPYGTLGSKLFLEGFNAAMGPAAYERGER